MDGDNSKSDRMIRNQLSDKTIIYKELNDENEQLIGKLVGRAF